MTSLSGPACILCDGQGGAHDPACPSLIPSEALPDQLSPAELDLLARRTDIFLADATNRHLERHLTRAATMALLAITRRALLPGGKDPAMTSLRATRELIQLGEEWFKAIEHREQPPAPSAPEEPEPKRIGKHAPPVAERKSRRRRV